MERSNGNFLSAALTCVGRRRDQCWQKQSVFGVLDRLYEECWSKKDMKEVAR